LFSCRQGISDYFYAEFTAKLTILSMFAAPMIKTICVFCGSGSGGNELYSFNARLLAQGFLKDNITLVYGGANVGLMGVIADTMLEGGGKVIGIMPEALVKKEVAHDNLTEMHIVEGMQERKAMMADLSDAFIALPGAYGTFDEIFEVLTWNQLGIVEKPIGLLNVGGYFDLMLSMLDHAVEEKFLRKEHRDILVVETGYPALLEKLKGFRPVVAEKWIERLKKGKI
jgi:uncharacterized protein (TIGR00730 family)